MFNPGDTRLVRAAAALDSDLDFVDFQVYPTPPDALLAQHVENFAANCVAARRRRGGGEYCVGMESQFERITIDPSKMRGAPCIRGLRIPVATVLGQLAAGVSAEDILRDFPDLEPDDISAALEYAAAAVQERELPLTRLA